MKLDKNLKEAIRLFVDAILAGDESPIRTESLSKLRKLGEDGQMLAKVFINHSFDVAQAIVTFFLLSAVSNISGIGDKIQDRKHPDIGSKSFADIHAFFELRIEVSVIRL